jgi:hypothetical protein
MEFVKNNKLVTAVIVAVIAGLTAFLAAWNGEETPAVEEQAPTVEAVPAEVAPAAEPAAPATESTSTPAVEPAAEPVAPAATETKTK